MQLVVRGFDKGIVAGDVIDAGGAGDGGTETISVA